MISEEEYLQGILAEIETARGKKSRGIFRINARIPDSYAQRIKKHFAGNPHYDVELRKCKTCRKTWDILIYFRNL